MRLSTWGSVNARKPRSGKSWLPAGKGYGVASARRLSGTWPAALSLSNRSVSGALTSQRLFTVWPFFLPRYPRGCSAVSWGRTSRRAVPSWAKGGPPRPRRTERTGAGHTRQPNHLCKFIDHHSPSYSDRLLSREGLCKLNEVILAAETCAEELRGGAAFAGSFGDQPLSRGTSAGQEGPEVRRGLQEHLQPLVGPGLEGPHEFEQTHFSVFGLPQPRRQRGAEGGVEQKEAAASVEITQGGLFGLGRQRGQRQIAFPGLKDQVDLPS